jgi:mRNA interferase MazF
MKRGDIVTVVVQGNYGKPRPALIIESDLLPAADSVLVCLITSTLHEDTPFRRHPVDASPSTGLRVPSHVMIDKIISIRRQKCGLPIGALDSGSMLAVSRKLALVTGMRIEFVILLRQRYGSPCRRPRWALKTCVRIRSLGRSR